MVTPPPTSLVEMNAGDASRRFYIAVAAIMGLMGAFFWAIRGTSGYGGSAGGTLAGAGWATLWILFSTLGGNTSQRPYANGKMFAAITLGIAYGGMTGYGVYISWLNGVYQMNQEVTRPIAPWTGYAMLFLCGTHWGGVTGAFMAWARPQDSGGWKSGRTWGKWALRIGAATFGGWLAVQLTRWQPQWFLPYWSEGYYEIEEYTTSARAMRSAPNVLSHVGVFFGLLVLELLRRDREAIKMMLIMSLGFAIPFTIGGVWQTMHGSELRIDWWKNWEMTIGMGGGLAIGLAFFLHNRPTLQGAAQHTSRTERIFGIGLTLWYAMGIILLGAYEGFIQVQNLPEQFEASRVYAFYGYLAVATVLWIAWTIRTVRLPIEQLQIEKPMLVPMPCLLGILLIIIAAGYVTSIPAELRLANKVLLSLYSLYILISAGLGWFALRTRAMKD